MINQSKQSSSITNNSKINSGELWDTDLNIWNNELRIWDRLISTISNSTRLSSNMTNVAKPI